MQRLAGLIDRQRHHQQLHIGSTADGIFGAGRATHLPRTGGQRSGAVQRPLQAHLGKADRIAHLIVQRDRLVEAHDGSRLIVIL